MIGQATDAQTLTLTDGVVHQAVMLPQVFAVQALDLPWLRRQVLLQKVLETPLTDKTNSG